MNPSFCISTSTSEYPIFATGFLNVEDQDGNQYFATTSCPSYATTTVQTVVLPPDLSFLWMFLGIITWVTIFFSMVYLVRKLTD